MIDCSTCSVLGCQFNATNPKKSCEMYKPYMTPKNALHCMKFNCELAVCEECDLYGTVGTDHCFEDACREAIKALEKQIPKVPNYSGDGCYDGQLVIDTWECPCCSHQYEVDYDDYEYCPECGQHIDHSTLTADD